MGALVFKVAAAADVPAAVAAPPAVPQLGPTTRFATPADHRFAYEALLRDAAGDAGATALVLLAWRFGWPYGGGTGGRARFVCMSPALLDMTFPPEQEGCDEAVREWVGGRLPAVERAAFVAGLGRGDADGGLHVHVLAIQAKKALRDSVASAASATYP